MVNLGKFRRRCTLISLQISLITFLCLSASYSQESPLVKLTKLNDRLYKVTYNVGYLVNGLISIGEDGLLLVDTGGKTTVLELKKQLKLLGYDKPVYIINTHDHIDHTGGNGAFGKSPVIIAHKNLRSRLQHGVYIVQEYPDAALPDIMVTDSLSLFFNGEEIRIIALPGSHDDSDIIVHFTTSGIACLGDLAYGMSFPSVDHRTGNDAKYAEVVKMAINLLPENTTVISGHGRDCTMKDMKQFQKMLEETTEIVRNALAEGKSVEMMQKENILKDWTSFNNNEFITTDQWIADLAGDILDPSPKESLVEPVLIAINEGGAETGIKKYYELKKYHKMEYHFHPYRLYQLGNYLIEKGRLQEAIKILEVNASEYPGDWLTFDGLGESNYKAGNKKEAIKYYEISLKLNPDNPKTIQQLQLLKKK